MVVGQAVGDGPPEDRTHRAAPAVLQLSEEDGLLLPPVLQEVPARVQRVSRADGRAEHDTLRLHLLFQASADHSCHVLTVLLGGAEHQTRVCRNDFSHQSDDVIRVQLLHRTRVLRGQRAETRRQHFTHRFVISSVCFFL